MSLTENHTIAELLYENGKLSAELEAERFMLELITSLSSTELIDDGINTVLREVGEYTCADRAYVFEINEDYTTTNTYEWCKEGVTPQIDNLKGIPFESMPNWIHLFLQGENILMEELEKAGVTGYVGKVNMDRNAAPGLLEETTEESRRETLRWLDACQDFRLVKPMLTPRFTPSCTDELMAFLGKLAAERDLPVQSHLSENQAEMAWVRQLHPGCQQYWETYAKYGLWTSRTVMAHCVWSDARERQAMRDAGVTAVHCADSNQNICSGVAPVRAMLNEGVKVALGSDIAGGDHLHMFDVVAASIRASKARRVLDNWETDFLTVPEGWYLATSAGAAYFAEQPGFAPGNHLHALVLADDDLPQPHPMTPQERLERAVYLRQGGAIRAVWSEGRKVFSAEG